MEGNPHLQFCRQSFQEKFSRGLPRNPRKNTTWLYDKCWGLQWCPRIYRSQIPSLIYTTSSMLVASPFSSLVSVFEKLSSTQIMALEDAQIDPNKYKKMVSKAVQQDSLMGRELTNRSEFGYKDEDILLAIVSNRLDWEIGFDEIEFINKHLRQTRE